MPHCQKEKHDHASKKKKKLPKEKAPRCRKQEDGGEEAALDDGDAPPPPEEEVEEDEVAEVVEEAVPEKKKELFVCVYTKKKFKSRATYENHLKSKKYLQLEAKAAKEKEQEALLLLEEEEEEESDDEDDEEENDEEEIPGVVVIVPAEEEEQSSAPAACSLGPVDDDSDSEWEDEEETPWTAFLRESLFDDVESETFAANLEYMERTYSFFVPYKPSLLDEGEAIFSHLQEKICRSHTCLFCRMVFDGREACLNHMADKGHRRVKFDDVFVFYDMDRGESFKRGDYLGEDIVLANGSRLGSRHYRKYYKQKFRPDDDRLSVRLNLLAEKKSELLTHSRKDGRLLSLLRGHSRAKGNSKALASQFVFKQDAADNEARRAIVHHWGAGGGGSHYSMAGSKQFQRGLRVKGVVSRHSKQAAKRGPAGSGGIKSTAKKSGSNLM